MKIKIKEGTPITICTKHLVYDIITDRDVIFDEKELNYDRAVRVRTYNFKQPYPRWNDVVIKSMLWLREVEVLG